MNGLLMFRLILYSPVLKPRQFALSRKISFQLSGYLTNFQEHFHLCKTNFNLT